MGIDCSEFQQKEVLINHITQEINETGSIIEKAELAKRLLLEVETLLSCQSYDSRFDTCRNCHTISNLRKKTAAIILQAKEIKAKKS